MKLMPLRSAKRNGGIQKVTAMLKAGIDPQDLPASFPVGLTKPGCHI